MAFDPRLRGILMAITLALGPFVLSARAAPPIDPATIQRWVERMYGPGMSFNMQAKSVTVGAAENGIRPVEIVHQSGRTSRMQVEVATGEVTLVKRALSDRGIPQSLGRIHHPVTSSTILPLLPEGLRPGGAGSAGAAVHIGQPLATGISRVQVTVGEGAYRHFEYNHLTGKLTAVEPKAVTLPPRPVAVPKSLASKAAKARKLARAAKIAEKAAQTAKALERAQARPLPGMSGRAKIVAGVVAVGAVVAAVAWAKSQPARHEVTPSRGPDLDGEDLRNTGEPQSSP